MSTRWDENENDCFYGFRDVANTRTPILLSTRAWSCMVIEMKKVVTKTPDDPFSVLLLLLHSLWLFRTHVYL